MAIIKQFRMSPTWPLTQAEKIALIERSAGQMGRLWAANPNVQPGPIAAYICVAGEIAESPEQSRFFQDQADAMYEKAGRQGQPICVMWSEAPPVEEIARHFVCTLHFEKPSA